MSFDPSSFDNDEIAILREMLEVAYRHQHRETWEVSVSGAEYHRASAKRRLEILGNLLNKFGSSSENAMQAVEGNGPLRER